MVGNDSMIGNFPFVHSVCFSPFKERNTQDFCWGPKFPGQLREGQARPCLALPQAVLMFVYSSCCFIVLLGSTSCKQLSTENE